MIMSYQRQRAIEEQEKRPRPAQFAIVGKVDTVNHRATLIFSDSEKESVKQYLYESNISIVTGDRVKVQKVSGTYIIIGKL